jgi:hypothetical protein
MTKALSILAACAILTGCGTIHFQSPFAFNKPTITQPATPSAPAPTPVQQVVQKQVWLFWIAGVVCLFAAGVLAYFGQYMVALKVGLAGLILPIFATWWSEHYALVIAAVLIGLAVWYFLTHQAALSAVKSFFDKQNKTP